MKKLRDHQVEGLSKMRNGTILGGDVGTGKTLTSLAYYVQEVCGGNIDDFSVPMAHPKDLVVITTAKKRNTQDWQNEALHMGIFEDPEVSYGHMSFTVDSWNNLHKYVGAKNTFFIFDEQRLVGSGAWVKAFLKIARDEPTNEWVLLSATPADSWMDYAPVFIANGFYRNRTEFIEEHVIYTFQGKYRKIKGYYGVKKLKYYREQLFVDMPYDRHTVRHVIETYVDHDEGMFQSVWRRRWNVYEDCPLIDVSEMYRVARRVVNEDGRRLDAIAEIFEKHPRLIIFYNFDYELEMLRTLHSRLDVVVAEYNGHRHEDVPGTEKWLYLVQYTAGAEGWNCIETDTVVYYSLNYSHKIFEQTQGRIDRLNTPFSDLFYYILMSRSKVDKRIWGVVKEKKSFHEGRNVKLAA